VLVFNLATSEAFLVHYLIYKNVEVGHFTVSSGFHNSLVVISILLGYGAASLGQWCLRNSGTTYTGMQYHITEEQNPPECYAL
jgi:hypothetical protein